MAQMQLYGNLPYKCSIQKKRQIQLVVRDRMNSICMFFFSYDRYNDMETRLNKSRCNKAQSQVSVMGVKTA